MEDEIRGIIETKGLALTGSRAICPQVVAETSDTDYIAWVPKLATAFKLLIDAGFVGGASMEEDAMGVAVVKPGTKFISLKRDNLNVIATEDESFFKGFMLATQLGLTVKSQRVQLFQAILYGNG